MRKTLSEIAAIVGGEVDGDEDLIITGLNSIQTAKEGELTFLSNNKYLSLVKETKASAIMIPRDMSIPGKSIIRTDNPSLAFAQVASQLIKGEEKHFEGIHQSAVIAKEVCLGKNVAMGPNVVIDNKVTIGDNSIIYAGSYVGHDAQIGQDCLIYPNVTIREESVIGDRVIIHSGTVIGSDGFGYEKVDGKHVKIPQIGITVIEDDVEIGSNVTIDRARFNKTLIGRGSKIDNLVQIAHNVVIGEYCIIISQVGISGTVVIEKNSILAGQAGVAGHLTIGEGSVVAAQAGVTKSLPANSYVMGYPAKPHTQAKKTYASLQKLPENMKELRALKKRVEELES